MKTFIAAAVLITAGLFTHPGLIWMGAVVLFWKWLLDTPYTSSRK